MTDFYIQFNRHEMFFIFKIEEWDFTLFHAHLKPNERYNPDDLYYEIWVDRCGIIHLTMGDQSYNTAMPVAKNAWVRLQI